MGNTPENALKAPMPATDEDAPELPGMNRQGNETPQACCQEAGNSAATPNPADPGGAAHPSEPKGLKVFILVMISVFGLLAGLGTFIPNGEFSVAGGNFLGALLVAFGGLFGCLHAADLVPEKLASWSWALVVVGGFAIAGSALQAVMFAAPAGGA